VVTKGNAITKNSVTTKAATKKALNVFFIISLSFVII
jgi:hypothetical protein